MWYFRLIYSCMIDMVCKQGTGSYSDNSYSAAKVFMQVMFVTVTVPLGITLYALCVGHFSMFTSAQLHLSVTHFCSAVPVL